MALPPLFVAAREGRIDQVRDLLTAGADPEERCDPVYDHGAFFISVTALMAAAASPRSNAETVLALLTGRADPFAVSAGEVSALWYAAGGGTRFADFGDLDANHPFRDWGGGDVERVRLLLDAGLPANEAADNGRTALGEACAAGDPARVALLIERGASVWPAKVTKRDWGLSDAVKAITEVIPDMGPDPSGYMSFAVPLFLAARSGSIECVNLILAQGFPADFVCDGENALIHARTAEMAELFLDLGLKDREDGGFDSIDAMFENGRLADAIALIRRIADPIKRQAVFNEKLLLCSGVRMNPEALRLLIAEGAEVTRLDQDGRGALHTACWIGDGNGGLESSVTEEVLRVLLGAGADPNVKAKGCFPLHDAVDGDWASPTSVRVLLEHGAVVDARDDSGWTPLMWAADAGEIECIRLLLAAGADPRPALPKAERHLKAWEVSACDTPEKVARYLGDHGLDSFFTVDDTMTRHAEALSTAREALALLQEAVRRK